MRLPYCNDYGTLYQRMHTWDLVLLKMFNNLKTLKIALLHRSTFFNSCRIDLHLPSLERLCITPVAGEVHHSSPPVMHLLFLHRVLLLEKLKTVNLSVFIPDSKALLAFVRDQPSVVACAHSFEELYLKVQHGSVDALASGRQQTKQR